MQFESLVVVPSDRFGEIELYFSKRGTNLWVNRPESFRNVREFLGEPAIPQVLVDADNVVYMQDPDRQVSVGGCSKTITEVAEQLYERYLETGKSVTRLRSPVSGFLDTLTDFIFTMVVPGLGLYRGAALLPQSLWDKTYLQDQASSPNAYALAIHKNFRL